MAGATVSAIAKAYKSRSMSKGPKRTRLRRGGTSRLRRRAARSRRGFGRSTPIHRRDGTLNPKAYPKKGGWGDKAQRALISKAKEGKGMEAAKTRDLTADQRKARRASRQSSVAGSKAARQLKIRKAQKAAGSAGNSPAEQPMTKTHGARKIAVQRLKGKVQQSTAKRGKRRSKKLRMIAKLRAFGGKRSKKSRMIAKLRARG